LLSQIRIASMPPDPNLRSPQNQPKNLLGFLGNHHHTRWSLLEASEVLLLEAKYSGRFTGWIYRRFPPFFFFCCTETSFSCSEREKNSNRKSEQLSGLLFCCAHLPQHAALGIQVNKNGTWNIPHGVKRLSSPSPTTDSMIYNSKVKTSETSNTTSYLVSY
jgi:hypothetical protein